MTNLGVPLVGVCGASKGAVLTRPGDTGGGGRGDDGNVGARREVSLPTGEAGGVMGGGSFVLLNFRLNKSASLGMRDLGTEEARRRRECCDEEVTLSSSASMRTDLRPREGAVSGMAPSFSPALVRRPRRLDATLVKKLRDSDPVDLAMLASKVARTLPRRPLPLICLLFVVVMIIDCKSLQPSGTTVFP
jgi:hypothetical protein